MLSNTYQSSNCDSSDINGIIEIYISDPIQYRDTYNSIVSSYSSAISNGYVLETHEYSKHSLATDYELFSEAEKFIQYYENYSQTVNDILRESELRKAEFDSKGEDKDSFSYIYQEQIISTYKNHPYIMSSDDIFNSGWDTFINYDYINIFVLTAILIYCGHIYNVERYSGTLSIITTAKHGQKQFTFTKIIFTVTIALIITLIFNLSSIIYIELSVGFSSASMPAQSIPSLALVPYNITISETVFILLFNRCIVSVIVALITLSFSLFFEYAITYLLSALIILINIIVWVLPSSIQYKYCNLFSVSSISFISRYRAVSLFGYFYFDLQPLTLTFYVILFIILCVIIFITPIKNPILVEKNTLLSLLEKVNFHSFAFRFTIPPSFFYNYYASETLKHRGIIIVVLCILFSRCLYIFSSASQQQSNTNKMYQEYMDILQGDYTPEKFSYILDEKKYISSILAQETNMRISYELGTIDESTYRKYQKEFFYCSERSIAINQIYSHAKYLQKIYESNEFSPVFFYDEGISKLTDTSIDPFIIIILLLFCCNIFHSEQRSTSSSNPMRNIIRTTYGGQSHLYFVKFRLCIFLIFTVILFSSIVNFIKLDQYYNVSNYAPVVWGADIRNIESYSNCAVQLKCKEYIFFVFIVKIIGYLIISNICFCLSNICQKEITTYISTVLILILPFFINYVGTGNLNYLSPLSICNPNDLFLSIQFFYSSYIFPVLLVVILNIISHKKWNT